MTARNGGSGWTSPQILLTILGMIMMTIGGYLAIARDDTREIRDKVERLTAKVAHIEGRLEERRPRSAE